MFSLDIEYGSESLSIRLPVACDVRGMNSTEVLPDPKEVIRRSYLFPIDSLPLHELAGEKLGANPYATTVVVVSDNTRPVPYRGDGGILNPLLETLIDAGFAQDRITILIGNGSHRSMSELEIEAMLGLGEVGFTVPVVNHNYENWEELVYVGKTGRGSPVRINRKYAEAELKIVTGLVESHFMAGASGGRKAICPAITGKETLRIFHGPEILASPKAADLVLDGNPCSEEAEQAAELAGCDFAVNVTLDSAKRIAGVYSGNITASHRAAVEKLRQYVVVPLERRYDLVVIPGGFVAVNHYQAAKAAVIASRALNPGGIIVLIARHSDPDPVGSEDYRKTLAMLKRDGSERFLRTIKSPDWSFTHDQWETQMWSKVLDVVEDEENLIYCSLEIAEEEYTLLPGIPGKRFVKHLERIPRPPAKEQMKTMVESVLREAIKKLRVRLNKDPEVLLLRDGPYGVPEVSDSKTSLRS